jgi:hypothetical protein
MKTIKKQWSMVNDRLFQISIEHYPDWTGLVTVRWKLTPTDSEHSCTLHAEQLAQGYINRGDEVLPYNVACAVIARVAVLVTHHNISKLMERQS